MKGIYLTRTVNVTLVPAFPSDYEVIKAIPAGELILAELKLDRNPKFSRKFFALLKFFREHLPESITNKYSTPEDFRKFILYYAGITEEFKDHKGVIHIVPRSLAFDSMDELEFSRVYSIVKMEIINGFFAGSTTDEFEKELSSFL